MLSSNFDKASQNTDPLQNNPYNLQPRFYSSNANNSKYHSYQESSTLLYNTYDEPRKKPSDPTQHIFTSSFDIDDVRSVPPSRNTKFEHQSDDAQTIQKLIGDDHQAEEEDIHALLNEIDNYAGT